MAGFKNLKLCFRADFFSFLKFKMLGLLLQCTSKFLMRFSQVLDIEEKGAVTCKIIGNLVCCWCFPSPPPPLPLSGFLTSSEGLFQLQCQSVILEFHRGKSKESGFFWRLILFSQLLI